MNDELQKIWEALRMIYGMDMIAGTVTVLVKDGDTAVRYVTSSYPQEKDE